MQLRKTLNEEYYLFEYYSIFDKEDELSMLIYNAFKKEEDWAYQQISDVFIEAIDVFIDQIRWDDEQIAVAIIPSHKKGHYGKNIVRLANELCDNLGLRRKNNLIQRTVTKQKSTAGGERTVEAHLSTLDIGATLERDINYYFIIDDITTTGCSLEAAKELLIRNGIDEKKIIKIAVAKTFHA